MSSSYIGKVLDNYRIIENLGIGGMGVVFKAIHIKLDKVFALKMIAPGLMMNESFIKRFQTEAKALAKLEDPNIVRISDLRADNDQWFIVMEFVEGINLHEKIKADGAFRWQEALPILKQILTGVGHAHAAGIIHRDLKPNNIMLTKDHLVKITDFGLAKDQSSQLTTLSLASGGTLFYMSPEHVKGISFTDKRSDIYSIGMTFYEMITGFVPFKNLESDFDIRETIVRKNLTKPSVYNPEIPPLLESIIMKSLAKNPDDRYQKTDSMLEAILEFEEKFPLVEMGQELFSGKSYSRKNNFATSHIDGPDTRIEKVLKKQSKDFFRHYGIILAVLFVIILSTLIYFVSSGSKVPAKKSAGLIGLNLSSDPDGALVYIDEDSVGTTPLTHLNLGVGPHRIRLTKTEYMPFDTLILLEPDKKKVFSFDLRPVQKDQPGPDIADKQQIPKLRIDKTGGRVALYASSDPVGATIWIDGVNKGSLPLQLNDIETGAHKVRIEMEGYLPYLNSIDLEGGKTGRITAKLIRMSGDLQIKTNPKEAIIKIDGEEVRGKKSPALLRDLPVGQHRIELIKPGYDQVTEEVQIERDVVSMLTVDLMRLKGKLAVQVRPWGSIYLNNEIQKASSDIKYQVELPVENYLLKVVHPTFGKWEKSIQMKANETLNVVVDFNRKHTITVLAHDETGNTLSAFIFIDQKNMEKATPSDLELRTGIHRLVVKKDGYIATNGEEEILVEADKSYRFVLKKIE